MANQFDRAGARLNGWGYHQDTAVAEDFIERTVNVRHCFLAVSRQTEFDISVLPRRQNATAQFQHFFQIHFATGDMRFAEHAFHMRQDFINCGALNAAGHGHGRTYRRNDELVTVFECQIHIGTAMNKQAVKVDDSAAATADQFNLAHRPRFLDAFCVIQSIEHCMEDCQSLASGLLHVA